MKTALFILCGILTACESPPLPTDLGQFPLGWYVQTPEAIYVHTEDAASVLLLPEGPPVQFVPASSSLRRAAQQLQRLTNSPQPTFH
jgi:hypothetical protein